MLLDLDLSRFTSSLQIVKRENKKWIFDSLRSKWLVYQPEELVRQLLVQYFIQDRKINPNRIAVERQITVNEQTANELSKRCDLLIFDDNTNPWMLIECKAPEVELDKETCWQIGIYNMPLRVPFLLVCNGPDAYCFSINFSNSVFTFLEEVPKFLD